MRLASASRKRVISCTNNDLFVLDGPLAAGRIVGAEIIARVYEDIPDVLVSPARRLGAKHVPIPVAEPMENYVLPQVSDIIKVVEGMV